MAPPTKQCLLDKDPELHGKLVDLAAKGATNTLMAKLAGVHIDTFQRWLKVGKDEIRAHGEEPVEDWSPPPSCYARLVLDMDQASAELAVRMTERVIEAADSQMPNTWQAAMTFLERRYPHDYGRQEKRIHEHPDGVPSLPQINVLVLNDPNARAAHRDLLRSVDAANPARAGLAFGTGLGGELEAGSDGESVIDVDSRRTR